MGDNEACLLRLWREKRGELEPEGLSGILLVPLQALSEEAAWCRFRSRTPGPSPFSSVNAT
jgi:hypothetical protein